MRDDPIRGIIGTVVDTPRRGTLRIAADTLLVIDASGFIRERLAAADPGYLPRLEEMRKHGGLIELSRDQYLLPGLIDLHNHAPQWPQLGKALDVPLAEWLSRYTFPLEARYRDVEFASSVYEALVAATLANGTTTAVYFASAHLPATQRLADTCIDRGQRALVGRVAMDSPETCPDYYRDSSAALAIEETIALIDYITAHAENTGTVLPAVTPRFVPSCTDGLLRGLGEVATATGCHVQTHCSESDWAHGYGLERYGHSDTVTYQETGLLGKGTVLAHSNFVSAADMEMIRAAGAGIAHCPLSNVFFANAVFPARQALDAGLHVGLGTDVAGGPSASLLNSAVNAVAVSRLREDGVDASLAAGRRGTPRSRIRFAEAFWMATTGGGLALDLPIGVLNPGYAFDAIIVDAAVPDSDLMVWAEFDSAEDVFQKILQNATRRNIVGVWVQGKSVKPAPGS